MSVAALFPSIAPSRLGEFFLGEIPNYAAKLDSPIPVDDATFTRRILGWKRWAEKRQEMVRLRRLEGVLAIGNWLYEALRLVEQNWRREVLEGKTLYDPKEEASMLESYRRWSGPCQRCLNEIAHFDAVLTAVEGGDQFKRYCIDAKQILAENNPFFHDPKNAARWAVVTAFLRPNPRPVRVEKDGRIFEDSGEQILMPGLEPARVLEALDDERAGRLHSFDEVVASLDQHEI
jgi:hypothetical protein